MRKNRNTALFVCFLAALSMSASAEESYEAPPAFKAKDILPAELLSSEHHRVLETVQNDGYLNHYLIQSDYGDFDAHGRTMLRIRVREVAALAELDKVSKTGVFLKAAADAGIEDIKVITHLATHPLETVKGIPSGIAGLFRKVGNVMTDVADAGTELATGATDGNAVDAAAEAGELVGDVAGLPAVERRWAQKLRVDPYTSNETLSAAISEVAKVELAASTGAGFAVPSVPGMTYISGVNDVVWKKGPSELREENRLALLAMGATEDGAAAFLDSEHFSTSLRSVMVAALNRMDGVEGREILVGQALGASSEIDAWFFGVSTILVSWFHENEAPVDRLVGGINMPVMRTMDGRMVSILPVEHLSWTETIEAAAGRFTALADAQGIGGGRELWFGGTASDRCVEELSARGWTVRQNIRDRVDLPVNFSGTTGESK